jgi:hypothetical protein
MQVVQVTTKARFSNANGKIAFRYMWETGSKQWTTCPHNVIDTVSFITMWDRKQATAWCHNFMRDFF